jgi:hypothetical protein
VYHGYILRIADIILPKSPFHYQHTSSAFTWDAVCRSSKTFCWGVAALHIRSVPASRRPQNGALGANPLGGQNDVSRRVLHRDCTEDEDLIRLPVWPKPSTMLFQLLRRLYIRCELIVAPLSRNYTKKVPSLSQKTLTMTLSVEVCTLNLFSLILPTVPI